MKQNPYLTGLLTTAVLLLILGAVVFVIVLLTNSQWAPATTIAAFAFSLGAGALILWLHACAVVWTPADEPQARRNPGTN